MIMATFFGVLVGGLLSSSPSVFTFDNPGDIAFSGGASVLSAPLYSLRSGNPHYQAGAALRTSLNPGATITSAAFEYRYNT